MTLHGNISINYIIISLLEAVIIHTYRYEGVFRQLARYASCRHRFSTFMLIGRLELLLGRSTADIPRIKIGATAFYVPSERPTSSPY